MDGFSGGGFNNDGASPGGASGGDRPRRNYDEQTLIPVTIGMILGAASEPGGGGGENSIVLKDGRTLHMVKLVVAVRQAEMRSTNLLIDIEDGTGFSQAKVWVNEADDCSAVANLRQQASREHIYIRVIGQVKEYDGQRSIVANDIRPVTSGNELTYHLLEVAHSYEKSLKSQQPSASAGGYGIGSLASNNAPPPGGARNVQMQGQGGGPGGGSPLNECILRVIGNIAGEAGAHVDQIKAQVSSQGYSANHVEDAINHLSNEGHIYSTIDDLHFQVAE